MSLVSVTESSLENIAAAIRNKKGGTDTYTPGQMAGAINGIKTADEVNLVQKSITANGTYNPAGDSADGYSGVSVDVANSYTSADNGKVVSNQQLVAQTSKQITQNGTHDTTTNNSVSVAVPNLYSASDNGKVVVNQALVAQTSKNINANGTHDTTANNSVVVDVPNSYATADEGKVVSGGALVGQTSRNVTANGTYDTTNNNEVVVNVPTSGGGGTLIQKTITQNGTYNASDDNADGYSSVTVNVSGGESLDDNILGNGDFIINTTGVTQWDASNSGTSSTSRRPIIDDWEIMQCKAEKTAQGITITPSKSSAYLTQQIKKWYVGKNIKLSAIVNGSEYNITGVLSGGGTSLTLNTPFGQLYVYAYSYADIVFTLMFNNQIGNEFIITNAKVELA